MAFEQIRAGIALILDEIEKRPADRHILHEQLREKISELRTLGLEVPLELQRLEEELEEDEADDLFDNMPI